MDFWQILLCAVMKQGLDIDFDRLAKLWQKVNRIRRHHKLYATVIRHYLKLVDHLIAKLADTLSEFKNTYAVV
ncbi:MAG: hypothetical protein OXC62_15870 [Aestuariivita sp.]|nr:hypothetical protein [Aestuariivita sp.]